MTTPGHTLDNPDGCRCLACGGTEPVNPPPAPDPWEVAS